jgi:hypothetical protein
VITGAEETREMHSGEPFHFSFDGTPRSYVPKKAPELVRRPDPRNAVQRIYYFPTNCQVVLTRVPLFSVPPNMSV